MMEIDAAIIDAALKRERNRIWEQCALELEARAKAMQETFRFYGMGTCRTILTVAESIRANKEAE